MKNKREIIKSLLKKSKKRNCHSGQREEITSTLIPSLVRRGNRGGYYIFLAFVSFFIFHFSFLIGLSQGFDWQYSARMPSDSPITFIGACSEFDYSINTGSVNLSEKNIICTAFNNGTGLGWSLGGQIEHWQTGSIAFIGKLIFSNHSTTFKRQESVPEKDFDLVREFQLTSDLTYLDLELGIKSRIESTHLHIGGGVLLRLLLQNTNDYSWQVVSPAEYYQQHQLYNGTIKSYNNFLVSPFVSLGYDLNLGLGMYGTISYGISFPIMNQISNEEWRRWNAFISITVLRGVFF
jgi:hypothetical protein